MIRPTHLIALAILAGLAGCDGEDQDGKGKAGKAGVQQNTAGRGQDGRGLNMKMRGRPQVGQNRNKKDTIQPGGGNQPRGQAKRLLAKGEDGNASLVIARNGAIVVYLLSEDGKTPRVIDAERMRVWIKGTGEGMKTSPLMAVKTADGAAGASRFRSKPRAVELGKDLVMSVKYKAGEKMVSYKFRVPATYKPF